MASKRKNIKHRQKKSELLKKDSQIIEHEHKLRPCNYKQSLKFAIIAVLLYNKLVMKNYGHLDWADFEKELLAKPGFKEALEETITQAEIARRMNTKQSVISRVENARTMPSLAFLKRLAHVLDASLQVQFKFQ